MAKAYLRVATLKLFRNFPDLLQQYILYIFTKFSTRKSLFKYFSRNVWELFTQKTVENGVNFGLVLFTWKP